VRNAVTAKNREGKIMGFGNLGNNKQDGDPISKGWETFDNTTAEVNAANKDKALTDGIKKKEIIDSSVNTIAGHEEETGTDTYPFPSKDTYDKLPGQPDKSAPAA
jgi:hypothetical protein